MNLLTLDKKVSMNIIPFSMKINPTPPCVGRPKGFDPDEALEKAMQVFWQKGYEGASLSDLTESMGINRPSLYATFGNKEELFLKVLNRYGEGPAGYVLEALNEATARAVIEKLLRSTVEMLGDPKHPRGCLAVQSALCCGDEANDVQKKTRAFRVAGQKSIFERFERAQQDGDLPASVSADDLARYVAMLLYGLSIQSANGATHEEMKSVIEFALKTLPF